MARDHDGRAGARNSLQLALVELESHLQEVQRMRREFPWRSRAAPQLAVDVGEPLEGQRPKGCVYVERRPVMLHAPRKLMQRHDKHVAPACHASDMSTGTTPAAFPAERDSSAPLGPSTQFPPGPVSVERVASLQRGPLAVPLAPPSWLQPWVLQSFWRLQPSWVLPERVAFLCALQRS